MADSNATNRPRKGNSTRRRGTWRPVAYTGGPWPWYFCSFMEKVLTPVSVDGAEARDVQAQAWWDSLGPDVRYAMFRALETRTAQGAG